MDGDRDSGAARGMGDIWKGGVMEKLFPVIIITLSYAAGAVYACKGMLWPALYWAFAGSLNIAALMMAGAHG